MFATKKVKSDTYIIEFCVIIMAESQYMYLSSSTVKELGNYDVSLSDFLPEEIIPKVFPIPFQPGFTRYGSKEIFLR